MLKGVGVAFVRDWSLVAIYLKVEWLKGLSMGASNITEYVCKRP